MKMGKGAEPKAGDILTDASGKTWRFFGDNDDGYTISFSGPGPLESLRHFARAQIRRDGPGRLSLAAEAPKALSILDAPPGVYLLPELGVYFVKPIDPDECALIEGMSIRFGETDWSEHGIDRPYKAVLVDFGSAPAVALAPPEPSPRLSSSYFAELDAALLVVEGYLTQRGLPPAALEALGRAREAGLALCRERDRAEEERASDDARRYELVQRLLGDGRGTADNAMGDAERIVVWLREKRGGRP